MIAGRRCEGEAFFGCSSLGAGASAAEGAPVPGRAAGVWPPAWPRRAGERSLPPRYGILAEQWPDVRALMGDLADNIPGIRGIGTKTAARLLADSRRREDDPSQQPPHRCSGGPLLPTTHVLESLKLW
ncbi:5'-3' exonuclease H3TH domain-containing protein [Streptomyces radiopugnans]|uniref:5'-3' exonuclease H3TH domain-containing protein n=1 Tax=Streptomyces radiopugnans TaxID=403935 RepID=UPI003F1B6A21